LGVSQPVLDGLGYYLRHAPWRRGAGAFLRALAMLDGLGCAPPVVRTVDDDRFFWHGKDVVLFEILRSGAFEAGAAEAVRTRTPHGGTFVDVGANLGYYSVAASRWVGAAGKVFAFEPVPRTRSLLTANLELNRCENVEVLPLACSRACGRARMVTASDTGWSRLARDDGGDLDVDTTTIDAFVADRGLDRLDVLKIDVEGADFDVVRGAERTIERFRPAVLVEVEHTRGYGSDAGDVAAFFERRAYSTWLIDDGHSRDLFCDPHPVGDGPARSDGHGSRRPRRGPPAGADS